MARPLVLVYQEYANLSLNPAAVDQNLCVAAPSYDILEYSADDETTNKLIKVSTGLASAKANHAALLPLDTDTPAFAIPLASTKTVLSDASVVVVSPKVLTFAATNQTISSGALSEFVSTTAMDVVVGDTVYYVKTARDATDSVEEDTVLSVSLDKKRFTTYNASTSRTGSPMDVYVVRKYLGAYAVKAASVSVDKSAKTIGLKASPALFVANGPQITVGSTDYTLFETPEIYVQSVALRTDRDSVVTITGVTDVVNKLGKIDSRNPAAVAAYIAQLNAGTTILAYGVPSDSVTGFDKFIRDTSKRGDIYAVVPVSADSVVQKAVVSSLTATYANMASVDYALEKGVAQKFRLAIGGGLAAIVDSKTVSSPTGTVSFTRQGTTQLYTVNAAAGTFAVDGVRVGDALVANGVSYAVASVANNAYISVELGASQAAPPASASGVTVVRSMTSDDKVADLLPVPANYASKRLILPMATGVVIDLLGAAQQNGAYLACAIGGMIAGLPSHQGITNLTIAGISKVYGPDAFTDEQLTKLSDAGWCIFTQETATQAPYCIHGVTTDTSAVEFAEIMSVKNFDYVASVIAAQLNRFVGTWNLNDETLGFIRLSIGNAIKRLMDKKAPRIGAPLISANIKSVGPSDIAADRADAYVELVMPKTLNTIGLHLVSA